VTEADASTIAGHGRDTPDTFRENESRFDRIRHTVGLFPRTGRAAGTVVPPDAGAVGRGHRLPRGGLVVVWWTTEAIPIPATALIGTALTVVAGVATAQDAFAPFASPTIFLFIGSFIIGQAVTSITSTGAWRCHCCRFAASAGTSADRPGAGRFTAAVSAWMSNYCDTAMMVPIALGVLNATAAGRRRDSRVTSPFLLSIAYSASVGGIITPVGTPPNLITLGLLDKLTGARIDFLSWMILATPDRESS